MVNTGHQHAGFTVMELMIVVMIVAVLATIAAPNFTGLIGGTRIKGVASDLHMAFLKARSEAVKRNAAVRVQRTGANWATGWSVVVVSDGTVLAASAARDGIAITSPTNPANITYLQSGRVQGNLTPSFTINRQPAFATPSDKKGRCRTVTLGVSGIPTVSKVDCA
jgi:type IV fimbrial biogenesis protein FimT